MSKVSVIMPAYNAEKFIREAIESVVRQSFTDWVLTIVNDGSTDNTKNIICEYVKKYPNRISMLDKPINEGTVKGLNDLIKKSAGEYICWLSADDVYTEKMLEESVEFLDANAGYDLVYANYETIDENSSFLRPAPYNSVVEEIKEKNKFQPYNAMITMGNCMHGCTVMLRKKCYKKTGVFDAKYRYAHDYDLWLRMAANYNVGYIDRIHVRAREYASQISMQGHNEVDALHVIFDFMDKREWVLLYKKAGYQNEEQAIKAVIIGLMRTYKNREKEMKELYSIVCNGYNSIIEKYERSPMLRSLRSIMGYFYNGIWKRTEDYFRDDAENGYMQDICEIANTDAVLLNKQAIRFDRYDGNTFERFHRGLARSNNIVVGDVPFDILEEFLSENSEQYRFYMRGEPQKNVCIGISYYMYRILNIAQTLKMINIKKTNLDIWWELFRKLYDEDSEKIEGEK